MSPLCSEDCKVPTKTRQDDSSLDKGSSSRKADKAGRLRFLKKKKPKRVLYPAQVRKYLPRQEKDKARKWLLILGTIVFFQIFLEDDGQCDDHEGHKTLVAHTMLPGHSHTNVNSRTISGGQGLENMTLGNSTILHFLTSFQGRLDLRSYVLQPEK